MRSAPASSSAKRVNRVGRWVTSNSLSEGADDREETLQPALPARAGDLALADVADVRIGDARRQDAVVGADVDRSDDAGDLDALVAAVEGQEFLALHQHRAVGIDGGDGHADLARPSVRLRRLQTGKASCREQGWQ